MGAYDDGGMTRAIAAAKAAGIPTQSAGTPFGQAASKAPIKVEVERGDTLSSIAKENNTTVKAILAANPKFTEDPKYKGGNTIFAGTTVKIPPKASKPSTVSAAPTPTSTPTSTYSPGDFRKAEEKSNEPFYESQKVEDVKEVYLVPKNFIPNITPTPLTPSTISATVATPPPPPVKTATLDIILFDDEATTVDTMADLIFENIGGQELINITRSDIVNGQKISYQPIKNLSSIQQRYNPNNILSLQQTADKYFAGFSIKLEDKIPNEGNGANGENVYIEEGTGDLIIEFVNINNDEQIEVQITSDGTIYEANLGEINS
jgi:LysM repeat protein